MTTGDPVVGQYILSSVNNTPIPVRISASGDRFQEIIGGTLTLIADGAIRLVTESRRGFSREVIVTDADTVAGVYTHKDDVLLVTLEGSPVLEFHVVGDMISLDFSQNPLTGAKHVFAWKRQVDQDE